MSLVITVIIIIILACITLAYIFNGGLLDQTEMAAFETEKAFAREQIEMVLVDAVAEKNLNDEYNENEFLDEFIHKSDDTIRVKDDTIEKDGFLFELDRSVPKIGEFIRKIEDPIIDDIRVIEKTTNSVTIEVDARDDDDATYTYWIKKNTDGEDAWEEVKSGPENTCKFEGLEDDVVYDIKVKIENFRGEAEEVIHVTTQPMPTGAIEFTEVEWNEGEASVVVSTEEEGFTLQYQINGIDEDGWIDIASGGTIDGLEYADEVYARLWDGNNASDHAYLKVEDTVKPIVTLNAGEIASNSIEVNVKVVDKESGMIENPTYTYYIKKSEEGEENYRVPEGAENITLNEYTFRGLEDGVSYDIKVEVREDKAGNMGYSSLDGQTTKAIPGGDTGLADGAITFGNVEWDAGKATVAISTNTEYTIEYQVNGIDEDNWTNNENGGIVGGLEDEDIVYARLTDGNNYGDYAMLQIQDLGNPTVTVTEKDATSSAISVEAVAEDKESGMIENPTYTFEIKKSSEPESSYKTPEGAAGITDNYYTFTGLEDGVSYDIRVTVNGDIAGNIGTGYLDSRVTDAIPDGDIEGAITFGTPSWSGGKANITVSTNTEYTIEYQVNSIAGEWIPIENGGTISGLENPSTVYARLTDGTNVGQHAMVEVRDSNPPTVTVTATGKTSSSLSVKAAATDAESGMDSNVTYTYSIKKSSESNYTTPADGTTTTDTYTFTGLEDGVSYDIRVVVDGDAAGNTGTGYANNQTTNAIPGGSGATTSGAITFGSPSWSGGKASTTISTNTSYTIQYQVGSYTGSWTNISNGGRTTSVSHNTTIYARLTDGTNYGDYASITITDTTPPNSFSISASGVGSSYFTINGSTTDGQSGMNRYEYYVDGSNKGTSNYITGVSAGTHSVYVRAYDNAGNYRQSNTISVTTNVAPNTPSVSLYSRSTTSLQIQARATDSNDGQTLTYTLYTSTNGSSWTRKTSTSATEGNYVYLTASGLSNYTYYYYYVNVSDGYESRDSSKSGRARTYCPGNNRTCYTSYCSGSSSRTCSKCRGSGKIPCPGPVVQTHTTYMKCPKCGKANAAHQNHFKCQTCGITGTSDIMHEVNGCWYYSGTATNNHSNAKITCTTCKGRGYTTTSCSHGRTSSHRYCSHYSYTTSTSHRYCSHGYTSQHG